MKTSKDMWIVLDVDDTIVDTYVSGWQKFTSVAHELSLPAPNPILYGHLYGNLPFDLVVPRLFPSAEPDDVIRAYDARARELPPRPLADLRELLELAKALGVKVGVHTNGPCGKTRAKLAAVGIDESDVHFVITGSGAHRKPSAAAFADQRRACGDASAIWYVSDSPVDWAGAHRQGIQSIGVSGGPARRQTDGCTTPRLMLPTVAALPTVLPGLLEQVPLTAGELGEPLELVAFDAGFTLIDHVSAPEAMIIHVLQRCASTTVNAEQVREAMRRNAPLLQRHAAWAAPNDARAMLVGFYSEVLGALLQADHVAVGSQVHQLASDLLDTYISASNWRLVDHARTMLTAVRTANLRSAVFSNWQDHLPALIESLLPEQHMPVVASCTSGHAKPSAAAFHDAARRFATVPTRTSYVGDDASTDVIAALRAGVRAIYLPHNIDGLLAVRTIEHALPHHAGSAMINSSIEDLNSTEGTIRV